MPNIEISIRCQAWLTEIPEVEVVVRRSCEAALKRARGGDIDRIGSAEVSIVLADDRFARRLNRERRGIDRPTNVLSFPVLTSEQLKTFEPGAVCKGAGAPLMLGDVVVAFDISSREARKQGTSLSDHLCHLIVHGVLHLLGHDHGADGEARRMEGLESNILSGLGIADPHRSPGTGQGAAA